MGGSYSNYKICKWLKTHYSIQKDIAVILWLTIELKEFGSLVDLFQTRKFM